MRSSLGPYVLAGVCSLCLVLLIYALGNAMSPNWDMLYYLDMAEHGIIHNTKLVAPFAYRPAAPLLIGFFARALHVDALTAFRTATLIAAVIFGVSCFGFAKSQGFSTPISLAVMAALCLFWSHVKFPLFTQASVDIYAFPLMILAFWLLLEDRFYACLLVCALGLFFKEFLLIPLLILLAKKRANVWPLLLGALTIIACFIVPRLIIPVIATKQEIDPLNDPSSWVRLIDDPLNMDQNINIVFSYCAYFLPTLLLLTVPRLQKIRQFWRKNRAIFLPYIALDFLFVMYGGTNYTSFVAYLVPLHIMVLGIVLSEAARVEIVAMLLVIFLFNRLWLPIPQPERDVWTYVEYYGGWSDFVTPRTWFRFGEMALYIAGFQLLRMVIPVFSHRENDGNPPSPAHLPCD